MNKRYEELDSIRGLAAITVVISHIIQITPLPITGFVLNTPLRLFWAGHEAVILFFVLSGFVLSLPFYTGKTSKYPVYFFKRFLRIYLPYFIAILFAWLVRNLFYTGNIEELGDWFNGFWSVTLDKKLIINHFLLITDFNTEPLNTVIWSLIHEMRISIIFPLLMILILKTNWKISIFVAMIFSTVSAINSILGFDYSEGFFTSYMDSLHFISMFIFGALIAKHRKVIIESAQSLTWFIKYAMLFVGICFYTLSVGTKKYIPVGFDDIVQDWLISIGVCIFIISALSSPVIAKLLVKKPISFMGKISYSLYLYHMPVLLASYHLLFNRTSIWIILTIALFITFVLSSISWYFVEKNSVRLGKVISIRNGKEFRIPSH